MQHWTELRTALMLARHGTVSAAAEALHVHRATVSRHIDTLEAVFGTKLFQRHARGYTLTEAGQEMLDVASRADEMFTDLAGRHQGRSGLVSGRLIVTALHGLAPLILPSIQAFQQANPQITVDFLASAELARLEHGEAHVAFRAGAKPETPDYVVRLFRTIRFGLYASRAYVQRCGRPVDQNWSGHLFVGTPNARSPLPYAAWIAAHIGEDNMALTSWEQTVIGHGVRAGVGIGFMPVHEAADDPDLLEILSPSEDWSIPIWVVTHVDLHRTEKVQQFLKCL